MTLQQILNSPAFGFFAGITLGILIAAFSVFYCRLVSALKLLQKFSKLLLDAKPMKIKLIIDIELPDECMKASEEELRQNLFDDVINYLTICHLRDALKWTVKTIDTPNAKIIADHHKLWADICENARWNIVKQNELP